MFSRIKLFLSHLSQMHSLEVWLMSDASNQWTVHTAACCVQTDSRLSRQDTAARPWHISSSRPSCIKWSWRKVDGVVVKQGDVTFRFCLVWLQWEQLGSFTTRILKTLGTLQWFADLIDWGDQLLEFLFEGECRPVLVWCGVLTVLGLSFFLLSGFLVSGCVKCF